ncbi:MAG TPA: hypothetical protein VMW25_02105, partial [Clostridia bacterium]|nr:hypothetical protein [Clostridia bacterium]
VGTEKDVEQFNTVIETAENLGEYTELRAKSITENMKQAGHDGFVILYSKLYRKDNVREVGIFSSSSAISPATAEGKEQVYYHGSSKKWAGDFKPPQKGEYGSEAIFLAHSKRGAEYYVRDLEKGETKEVRLKPNLKIWDFQDKDDVQLVGDFIKKAGARKISPNTILSENELIEEIKQGRYDVIQRPAIMEFLRSEGYDGFQQIDWYDYGQDISTGIFEPKNILTPAQQAKPAPAEGRVETKKAEPKKKTKPLTKKRLLYLGHDIPRQLEWSEEQRRKFMKKTTGKESMKDMSRPEKKKYIEALNKELEKAGKEFEEAVSQKSVVLEALIEKNAGVEEVRPVEGLETESYRSLRRKVGSQASNFYQDLLRVERMLEKLDNYEKGPIRDNIWKPIKAADEMAIESTNVELREFRDTIKKMGANPDTWLTVYEKVEGTNLKLTKSQKVGVAMLSQNEKGNAALKTGMGMTDAEILDVVKSLDSTEKKIMEWFLQKYEE